MSIPADNMLLRHPTEIHLASRKSQRASKILMSSKRFVPNYSASNLQAYKTSQIRILQQLTIWTMGNPDRIRERMEEQKDTEQTLWVRGI